MSDPILSIRGLRKAYASGTEALKSVDLDIRRGEIFALLGPNGAGKTTMINIVCGIVTPSGGQVLVDGKDHLTDYRHARSRIGLVPQELTTDAFESVLSTVSFSRGLFGKPRDPAKRRVMIAKALSHEPDILFLDEPTAGVDVELRRDMWEMVRKLQSDGTTIILTTHYIEEAEEMADRVGVISKGELVAAEEKHALMRKLGRKTLKLTLADPMTEVPADLGEWNLALEDDGHVLCYQFDANAEKTGVPSLLRKVSDLGIGFKDLSTEQSSLEDIFVGLVHEERGK